ncbi:MAG TPA: sugar phosphate nucleotidyltransferase [Syntrophomonadaceae bacterium]|nr:sugar phosphate nucleotidyltransferase [Syntrophomonadaceae bacterium]
MVSVILAGGKGLRLWPESRRIKPKQLCKFVNNKSMLDHTIDRSIQAGADRIIIITSDDLAEIIQAVVNSRSDAEIIEILSEPEGKNTAPAVGLALSKYYTDLNNEILAVFPADHHVLDTASFKATVGKALQAAESNHIATIGVVPDRAETGYGYIEKTKWEIGDIPGVFQVNSFCEKPDLNTAENYLSSGNYMWNAGIYIAKTSVFLEEFEKYLPEIYGALISGFDNYYNSYSQLPNIRLDYGIAEKCSRMAVVAGDFGWCDLGSWNALSDLHQHDEMKNTCSGNDVIVLESANCLVKQSEKTVVLFGVDNLLVVETDDIILVSERHRAQDIRRIVDNLGQLERYDLL